MQVKFQVFEEKSDVRCVRSQTSSQSRLVQVVKSEWSLKSIRTTLSPTSQVSSLKPVMEVRNKAHVFSKQVQVKSRVSCSQNQFRSSLIIINHSRKFLRPKTKLESSRISSKQVLTCQVQVRIRVVSSIHFQFQLFLRIFLHPDEALQESNLKRVSEQLSSSRASSHR